MTVTLFLTLFSVITRRFTRELSNVSSEKLPRVAVILCLASCLIEGSSASSMSEIKHTALEGAGKTSASTIVVLEQQGLENADCRFCFSICQPHVVKMDCDRFCSGECPEDYIHLPFEDDMCLSMEVSEPAQKDNTFVGIIHVLVWPLLGCLVSYLVLDELELANGKRHYDCEETPVAGKLDKEQTSDSSYNEAVGDTSLSPGYKTNSCDNENQIGIEDSRSQQEIERNQILTADYNVKYRDIESYRNGSEKDHEENDEHKTEWCKYHRDCEETHVTGKRDEKHSVDSCYDEANLSTEEDPVFDKTNSCDNDDDIEVDLEGNTANCNVSDSERELCGNDLEKEHENEESKSEYLGKCHHDCEETHVIGIPDENQPDSSSYNAVGRETNLSSDDETNSCDNEDKIEIEDAQSQQDIEGNTANCNVSDLERESCGNYIGKEHENEENKAEYLGKVSLYKPAEEGIGEIHIHMITVCPMGVGKTCLSNQLFGQGLDIKTRTIAQAKNVVMRRFSILPYQHNKVWVMHHTGRNQHKQNQTDNKPISPQSSSAADRIFSKFHTTHKYKILSVNRDNKEDIDDLKSQTVLSTKISQNLKAIQMALQFMTPLEVVKPFNNPMLYKSSELFETPSQVEHKERRILSAYKQQQHGFRIAVGIRTFKVVKYFQKDSYYQTDHSPPIGNSQMKRKTERAQMTLKKKVKAVHVTTCREDSEKQSHGMESCHTYRYPTCKLQQALNGSPDGASKDDGEIIKVHDFVGNKTPEAATNKLMVELDMKDLKTLKQSRFPNDEQAKISCVKEENKAKQLDKSTGSRHHSLPIGSSAHPSVGVDELIDESEFSSVTSVTSRDSESDWKREKNLITALSIRTIQSLAVEARTHSREILRRYNKLYEHDYLDKKGEEQDDCHALRKVTWCSGEDLPIPRLEYTVAIVNSQVQKIMERIAIGERVGAHESMRFEILRVCTYRNYPGEDKPFRILLASAGWYYASDGDEVVCYCCGLRKSGWKEIDNPMEIHKQLRPSCDYLVRNSHVNVPIPELSAENAAKFRIFESNTSDSMPTGQSRQSEEASTSDSDNPQYRFFTPPPKHPQYAQLSARLDSFRKWPTNIPQTAQIMADCGYYYAGFGDCVRCFHCGIGLRHWTEDDYPWVEHARWSKDCAYLRQMKGEEFIQNVHLAIDNEEEPEDLVPETPSGRPADMSQTTPNEDSNQILLTDPAQSVLEMGYQPRIIKRAIDIILHNEGRSGISALKIMETIFMLEERDNTCNLQEGVANINISSASGGPDTPLKSAPNTRETESQATNETTQSVSTQSNSIGESQENAATGQTHGRSHSQGKDKTEKDQQKDVKTQLKETSKEKTESKKTPKNQDEAAAQSQNNEKQGAGKSKQKDTSKIKAENRKLKEQTICKVCLDKPVSIVFLPCGHLVTCAECAPAMKKCPICRALVKGSVKAFMS